MNYDLIIYEIKNSNAYTILAHQLARNPAITLQKAFEMLEKLPLTLFKNIDESTMHAHIMQYSHHGVTLKAFASDISNKQGNSDCRIPILQRVAQGYLLNDKQSTRKEAYSPDVNHKSSMGLKSDVQEMKVEGNQIKPTMLIAIILLVVLLVGLVILLFDSNRGFYNYTLMKKPIGISIIEAERQISDQETIRSKKIEDRTRVSTGQKMFSESMVDSAKINFFDLNRMIKFYKIAISFNRFNINAWFGLLSIYKRADMEVQYQQCLKDIKEIFGDQVFATSSIVESYGTITDSYISEDSILRISYKSEVKTEEPLLRHIHIIIRNLEAQPNLNGISVSSSNSENKEVIVHVRPGMHIETFDDFRQNASINVFK